MGRDIRIVSGSFPVIDAIQPSLPARVRLSVALSLQHSSSRSPPMIPSLNLDVSPIFPEKALRRVDGVSSFRASSDKSELDFEEGSELNSSASDSSSSIVLGWRSLRNSADVTPRIKTTAPHSETEFLEVSLQSHASVAVVKCRVLVRALVFLPEFELCAL